MFDTKQYLKNVTSAHCMHKHCRFKYPFCEGEKMSNIIEILSVEVVFVRNPRDTILNYVKVMDKRFRF